MKNNKGEGWLKKWGAYQLSSSEKGELIRGRGLNRGFTVIE